MWPLCSSLGMLDLFYLKYMSVSLSKDFDIGKISAAIDKHENFDRLTSKKEKDRLQKESTPARKTCIIASTCRFTWFCSRWRSKKILRRLDVGVLWYFEGHQACGWVPVSEEFLHKTHETLTKHHKPNICALSAPILQISKSFQGWSLGFEADATVVPARQ